jgi:hypothetical protein
MGYVYRNAARNWLNGTKWHVAATLTFSSETHEKAAERLLKHFVDEANRLIYKNAKRKNRGGKRLELVAIEENNSIETNLHLHLAIKMPKELGDDYELFCKFLAQLWKEHCGKNFIAEFKAIHDSTGWIDYITKGITGNNCDTLNLISSNVAAANLLIE